MQKKIFCTFLLVFMSYKRQNGINTSIFYHFLLSLLELTTVLATRLTITFIISCIAVSTVLAHPLGQKWLQLSNNHPVVAKWDQLVDAQTDKSITNQLVQINRFFNRNIRYGEDIDVWGDKDYWATPLESMLKGRGDCEDYAIAKYITLKLLGVPTEKLRLIYVRAKMGGAHSNISQAHMVLGYYETPNATPKILDNLIDDILPATQRTDLTPVFSFNDAGVWAANSTASASNPSERLSKWRDLLSKLQKEGYH